MILFALPNKEILRTENCINIIWQLSNHLVYFWMNYMKFLALKEVENLLKNVFSKMLICVGNSFKWVPYSVMKKIFKVKYGDFMPLKSILFDFGGCFRDNRHYLNVINFIYLYFMRLSFNFVFYCSTIRLWFRCAIFRTFSLLLQLFYQLLQILYFLQHYFLFIISITVRTWSLFDTLFFMARMRELFIFLTLSHQTRKDVSTFLWFF